MGCGCFSHVSTSRNSVTEVLKVITVLRHVQLLVNFIANLANRPSVAERKVEEDRVNGLSLLVLAKAFKRHEVGHMTSAPSGRHRDDAAAV